MAPAEQEAAPAVAEAEAPHAMALAAADGKVDGTVDSWVCGS
jgi:hypothetical protein